MYAVAVGDAKDGITLFGAWRLFEEATKFAEENYPEGGWHLTEIAMVHHEGQSDA